MRGVIWGLLFINCLFAAWIFYDSRRESVVVPQPSRLEVPASLQLLEELESSQLQPREIGSEEVLASAVAGVCVELGPYSTAEEAQSFADSLVDQEFEPIEYNEVQAVNYRAYIEPLDDRAQAEEVLERLRAVIEQQELRTDGFLIASGELINGISLGLFGERDNALALERALDAQGFAVLVREEVRMSQEFWLVSGQFETFADFQAWWSQIEQSQSELEPREKLCETIALPFQFP